MERRAAQILALVTVLTGVALVQTPAAPPVNPGGLRAVLTTAGGKRQYRVGEWIEVTLRLRSTAPADFGRLVAHPISCCVTLVPVSITVEPASGWSDPMAAMAAELPGTSGERVAVPILGPAAKEFADEFSTIEFPLNAYVRFDHPGTYTVRARDEEIYFRHARAVAMSEPLRLTIVDADGAWQRSEFDAAMRALPASPWAAEERLRYLGSQAATEEMVRQLNQLRGPAGGDRAIDASFDPNYYEALGGWVASPAKQSGFEEARRIFADPDTAVGQDLLTSGLWLLRDHYAEGREFWATLRAGLRQKRGRALVPSVYAAAVQTDPAAAPHTAEEVEWLGAQLAAHAAELTDNQKAELWLYVWDNVRRVAWLPALRRYAEYANPREAGAALRHWYELAPGEAGALMLAEVTNPNSKLADFAEYSGPLTPEQEDKVAAALESSPPRLAPTLVLEEAGTSRSEEAAWRAFPKETQCAAVEALLEYMLRIDPPAGAWLVTHEMPGSPAGGSRCGGFFPREVGEHVWNPDLEAALVSGFSGPHPQFAASGLQFASAAVQPMLWANLRTWCNVPHPGTQATVPTAEFVADALELNPHWLAGEAELREMARCGDPFISARATALLTQWQPRPWPLAYSKNGFTLLQYREIPTFAELEGLVSHLPRDSEFTLRAASPFIADGDAMEAQLAAMLQAHGMRLVP